MGDLLDRLVRRDATLWPPGNVAATRLGWLDVAARMRDEAKELRSWAAGIKAGHVLLLGMGGSSLGAEVLRASFGDTRLRVLDTTDPATVAAAPLDDSFFVVSSKSGTTLEVDALLRHCWHHVPDGARYAAITDPGSPLVALAAERGFARTFVNPTDIGGRYSVLSYFGLVPAALMGLDVAGLCQEAVEADHHEAVALGLAMGEAAQAGRDKVTVVVPEPFGSFGLWIEQLIAESTGKSGRGCIPVPTTEIEQGPDRHVVLLELDDPRQLGREFFRWEMATAVAGHVLAVDPFDEPNVSESKRNTQQALDDLPLPAVESAPPSSVTAWLRDTVGAGDYVSLQAYLPFGQDSALQRLRRTVRDGLGGAPVTVGYGPRFLHSTGQLHKGGPNSVVSVQIAPRRASAHLPIPDRPFDFGTLLDAQALGDLRSLQSHGRRVLRVEVDDLSDLA